MNTLSLEQLAEKLNGKLWIKEDKKRIYLDRGYNTKKMSTKTYVYQREDGSFGVSCYIDCPSQAYQWIQSQQEEVIKGVEESIEAAEFENENPGVDYYEHLESEKEKAELSEAQKDFQENIESYKNSFKRDYERAVEWNENHQKNREAFQNMTEEEKNKLAELKAERESILGTPGSAKRAKEIKEEIAKFPFVPYELDERTKEASKFNCAEDYVNFRIEEKKGSLGIVSEKSVLERISEEPKEEVPEFLAIEINFLPELLNKKIQWKAPAYRMNKPYGGIAIINETNITDRRPIKSTTVEGDDLDFAFVDQYTDGLIAYSDSDRLVTYKIIEDAN